MDCPECDTPTLSMSVPAEYRDDVPVTAATVAVCPRCLTLEPIDDGAAAAAGNDTDVSRISDAFPTDPESAVPLALAIGLCSSLATNRPAIEGLLESVERAGTDPLLVLDRLVADPSVEPAIDLERRRHQLEDLLY
ncbi:hypothetical protein C488_05012 [Natrinema pellirubrum DSM 15624]|uniref:Uncharacterized protein n=1 Tax=Natrinema pellirubrum (strain DSM 15624 / CIP 106293 / JCM 10476 / NCIMB 786 / 157) TaxID=797303 RepID=L0JG83_NATP1|nr:DUF6276 family protein [Natrinema pellirubrum]AGB30294.1 hypothetical protein Natpe_0362 [Natrinema pellirubrum DSM 15624]ELY79033.1 hypothetical protein C488_05012 [Natrinema pellirubrum DSM 15624]